VVQVSRDLFRTLGIRLLAGRSFTGSDGADDFPAAVVNQALVDRYFGGVEPVGRTVLVGGDYEAEVVGVVEDVRHHDVAEPPAPTLYLHQEQSPRRGVTVVVRTDGQDGPVMAGLRTIVSELDPDQPITELTTLSRVMSDSLARPRFFTLLLGAFGALAMVLSALGIYGVVAYLTRGRTREVGLRIALGATGREVVGLVMRQGMLPALAGLGVGLAAALGLSRLMESLLYGVTAADPVTYLSVAVGLFAVAALACLVPARRASRVDPVTALRSE
jgi:predicted permease